jgi:'Cold-shock' DNA-binding domain
MTFDGELMAKLKADEPTREFGVCVKFKNEAGYGFLEPDDDPYTHLFVHVRDCYYK